MRLHAITDGRVVATDGRDVHVGPASGPLEQVGRLPLPDDAGSAVRYHLLTTDPARRLTERLVGAVSTVNVWPLSDGSMLATVGPQTLVSDDGGRRWERAGRLPPSSGPMGVLPSAVAHHDGVTYLGEYPLATDATPRVRRSVDGGRTWETSVALPDVRHVHAVQRDPYTGALWATTGDTDAESRIGRLVDGAFQPVGGGSQEWRAVELAFTPDAVLWGMDCGYAEENWIFRLSREAFDEPDPAPEPLARVPGSVYYAATATVDGDRWVAFSTAMEAGQDSTGPAGHATPDQRGVVVAASSASSYGEWHEVASFRRRRSLADSLPIDLPRANGYVFLEADPDVGLLVNPYNTDSESGTIKRHPFDRLREGSRRSPATATS